MSDAPLGLQILRRAINEESGGYWLPTDEVLRRILSAITPAMASEVLLESVPAKNLAIGAMRPETMGGRDICHHRWKYALLAIAQRPMNTRKNRTASNTPKKCIKITPL